LNVGMLYSTELPNWLTREVPFLFIRDVNSTGSPVWDGKDNGIGEKERLEIVCEAGSKSINHTNSNGGYSPCDIWDENYY